MIELQLIDTDRLQGALRGLRLGIAPLWAAGRLPALLENPKARETIAAYEALLFEAVAQWSRARSSGDRTFTLRLHIPEEEAEAVIALARQLCEIMVDPEVMFAVGIPPASIADARFALELIEHAQRAVRSGDRLGGPG